jgi:hypothetical protein
VSAADIVSIIGALAAAAVAIIAAWRGENVRKELRTHVQDFHLLHPGASGRSSQE